MELQAFEILREEWTVVRLEDETTVVLRPVLLFATKVEQETPRRRVEARWKTEIAVWASTKGEPSATSPSGPDLLSHTVDPNLAFKFLQEGSSEYEMEDGAILSLKALPKKFAKTDLHDKNGEPIYNVDFEVQQGFTPPTSTPDAD